jgi:hypothetical protein
MKGKERREELGWKDSSFSTLASRSAEYQAILGSKANSPRGEEVKEDQRGQVTEAQGEVR